MTNNNSYSSSISLVSSDQKLINDIRNILGDNKNLSYYDEISGSIDSDIVILDVDNAGMGKKDRLY